MSDAYGAGIDSLPSIGAGTAPAQPMDITSDAQKNAVDPNAGAGWKQGATMVGNAFNDTLGKFRVDGGKFTSGQGQSMTGQPKPAAPQGMSGMIQQAAALLAKGAISADQYAKLVAQSGGAPALPPGVTDQIAGPVGSASGPAAPTEQLQMQASDPRLGPTSQAWGN